MRLALYGCTVEVTPVQVRSCEVLQVTYLWFEPESLESTSL